MKTLLISEEQIEPKKLISLLNFDGMPLTSNFIVDGMQQAIHDNKNIKKSISPPIKIV